MVGITKVTQIGAAIPIEIEMPSNASEGPVIRYAPERSFPGTPLGTTTPRIMLTIDNEIEMMEAEKGKTHK